MNWTQPSSPPFPLEQLQVDRARTSKLSSIPPLSSTPLPISLLPRPRGKTLPLTLLLLRMPSSFLHNPVHVPFLHFQILIAALRHAGSLSPWFSIRLPH